jgi:hypothetical protein
MSDYSHNAYRASLFADIGQLFSVGKGTTEEVNEIVERILNVQITRRHLFGPEVRGIIEKKYQKNVHTTRCVIGTLLAPGVSGGASDDAEEEEEDPNVGEFFERVADMPFPVE